MTLFTLAVNDEQYTVDTDADTPLLWVLRDTLGLTGTKYSCGMGISGACSVHVDGELIRSCATTVSEIGGGQVTTIEGLSTDGLHPLQLAWIAERVSQCGYCQPGQIMAAVALLNNNPHPADEDIDDAMSHNLCRCGTYQRIRRAIHRAAEEGGAL